MTECEPARFWRQELHRLATGPGLSPIHAGGSVRPAQIALALRQSRTLLVAVPVSPTESLVEVLDHFSAGLCRRNLGVGGARPVDPRSARNIEPRHPSAIVACQGTVRPRGRRRSSLAGIFISIVARRCRLLCGVHRSRIALRIVAQRSGRRHNRRCPASSACRRAPVGPSGMRQHLDLAPRFVRCAARRDSAA